MNNLYRVAYYQKDCKLNRYRKVEYSMVDIAYRDMDDSNQYHIGNFTLIDNKNGTLIYCEDDIFLNYALWGTNNGVNHFDTLENCLLHLEIERIK